MIPPPYLRRHLHLPAAHLHRPANSLTHHYIGLEQTDDGIWSIDFNTVLLAKLDERDDIIRG